jgi:hypothetical protein
MPVLDSIEEAGLWASVHPVARLPVKKAVVLHNRNYKLGQRAFGRERAPRQSLLVQDVLAVGIVAGSWRERGWMLIDEGCNIRAGALGLHINGVFILPWSFSIRTRLHR